MIQFGVLFAASGSATAVWYWSDPERLCSAYYPVEPGGSFAIWQEVKATAIISADQDRPLYDDLPAWTRATIVALLGAPDDLIAIPADLPAAPARHGLFLQTGRRLVVHVPLVRHPKAEHDVPDIRRGIPVINLGGPASNKE